VSHATASGAAQSAALERAPDRLLNGDPAGQQGRQEHQRFKKLQEHQHFVRIEAHGQWHEGWSVIAERTLDGQKSCKSISLSCGSKLSGSGRGLGR
jgi:hypothetical protein